ncbi:MAG: HEAT repeat domain-containing protein [Methanoregula sp.]|nr:MAG: HEAT repeat domain-containing protein [Methanoregula sp.]
MSDTRGLLMPLFGSLNIRQPDISAMREARDINGLNSLLDHGNFDIQWRAADALGTVGAEAVPVLLASLHHRSINTRVGAIEALAAIRDARATGPLATLLKSEETSEIRWAAALALGEIGDTNSIPLLVKSLQDMDRYVRYGAAKALEQLGWKPESDADKAYYLLAHQNWDGAKKIGRQATGPIISLLKEKHPATRARMVELLGSIGGPDAKAACNLALQDSDSSVRWNAVLASRKCGIPITRLPVGLSQRPKSGPSPFGSALLNFFFLGLGYNYMGKWWGFLIFMSYMTLIVFAQLDLGPFLPFILAYPVTAVFATQTYFMAKRESEMTG